MNLKQFFKNRIRIDRGEFGGAFGDIGTDLPLIVGIIQTTNMDVASVFIMFGLMQIMTGVIYGIPMAVQPLKAMAVIVISQKLGANVLLGGGLAIGVIMLLLTISGMLNLLRRIIPTVAIRGIQLGLGISLASIAIQKHIISTSEGYILSLVTIMLILLLRRSIRYPASVVVILLGLIYSLIFCVDIQKIYQNVSISLPTATAISIDDLLTGLTLLAIPQLPLSLSNSVFATHQTIKDLFPDKSLNIKKIGFTYSVMNLINPVFGGIPTCHGAGGLIGQYYFGGRTGGSVVIYGCIYIILGTFFSQIFSEIIRIFPLPVLGSILLFEGMAIMMLIQDISSNKDDLSIALLTGVIAAFMKNGFVIGIVLGTTLYYWYRYLKRSPEKKDQ